MKLTTDDKVCIGAGLLWLAALCACPARGQVVVSMDIVPGKALKSQIGIGGAAYPWNLHVCAIGPQPVPFQAIRLEFPELRFYLADQQTAILATRVSSSAPARLAKAAGYLALAAGVALQANAAFNKSSSQVGTAVSTGAGIATAVQALLAKQVPSYQLTDPVPPVISLSQGSCADYTALAAAGHAPVTIKVRRVDPIAPAKQLAPAAPAIGAIPPTS